MRETSAPRVWGRNPLTAVWVVVVAALWIVPMWVVVGSTPAAGSTSGNASAAVGFLEQAQNTDGGFGEKPGEASDPKASLWASLALLSAGKHPHDELLIGGVSAQDYLESHATSYTSLSDLGALAMVRASAQLPATALGDPTARLRSALTPATAKADPPGAAYAILGLIADGSDDARAQATTIARALLDDAFPDGGWGAGQSDSVSTALVLQALAVSGVANAQTPAVVAGVAALKAAQGNDGSIATSNRTDLALAAGDVAATAYTVQALQALKLPPITNSNGKTVLDGLTQYQQQASGGLCDDCAYYSQVKPSVYATALAFPSFNGVVLPPAAVAPGNAVPRAKVTPTPTPTPTRPSATGTPSRRNSSGKATQGANGNHNRATTDPGAYNHAQAATSTPKSSATSATPGTGPSPTPGNVSGQVVTAEQPPTLVTAKGGDAKAGLTARAKARIALGGALVLALLLGIVADGRRPRADARPAVTVGLEGLATTWTRARQRGALIPAAVSLIGVGLVLIPVTTGMFEKTAQGNDMIASFAPHLTEKKLADYQKDVDVLNAGVTEALNKGPSLLYPNLSEADAKQEFAKNQTMIAPLAQTWPDVNDNLQGVVGTAAANREGFEGIQALPPLSSFPWFFVVPGAILAIVGLLGVVTALRRLRGWHILRWVVLTVGIGLVIAPTVFSLWTRAPAGGRMITAFAAIENRHEVTQVQHDFGQLASISAGLGSLTSQVQADGKLTPAEVDGALPAVSEFNDRWVTVLHDFTPLLGAMSDSVPDYQAVAALPDFALFPWLFAVPGVVLVLMVVGPSWQRSRQHSRSTATHIVVNNEGVHP